MQKSTPVPALTDPIAEPTADMLARAVLALQRRWQARLIETHISWVLLDGTHAWKIK
jgi:aminoglycoside phosphotransferase family enzyme